MMIGKPARLLLWGGGENFSRSLPWLRERERNGEIRIVGIVDRCRPESGMIDGCPYVPPEAVPETEYDFLQILSARHRAEIRENYLRLKGSDPDKLIGQVYPEISIEQYFRILEARPTIFSSMCWGGYVYHYLGMECLSPFKNLWVREEDFLRFLHDPHGYMAEDPVPVRMQKAMTDYDRSVYPVLRLGDIFLNCNHSDSMEQAVADWLRRREKINWDFTVAVMSTIDRNFEKRFSRLDSFDRKLCLVPFRTAKRVSQSLPLKNAENDPYGWIRRVNSTAFPFRNPFDMNSVFFGERKKNRCYDPAL